MLKGNLLTRLTLQNDVSIIGSKLQSGSIYLL